MNRCDLDALLPGRAWSRRDGVAPPLLRYAPRRVVLRGLGGVPPAARRVDPLLRANGFDVLDLIELQAPEGAPDPTFDYATTEWAHNGRRRRSGSRASAPSGRLRRSGRRFLARRRPQRAWLRIVASGCANRCTWPPRRVSRNGSTSSSARDASACRSRDGRCCPRAVPRHSRARALGRPDRSALDRLPPPLPDRPPRLRHVHGARREPRRARASRPRGPRAPEADHLSACESRRASTRTWAASSRSVLADDCTPAIGDGLEPAAAQDPVSALGKVLRLDVDLPLAAARSRGDRPPQSVAILLRPAHRRSLHRRRGRACVRGDQRHPPGDARACPTSAGVPSRPRGREAGVRPATPIPHALRSGHRRLRLSRQRAPGGARPLLLRGHVLRRGCGAFAPRLPHPGRGRSRSPSASSRPSARTRQASSTWSRAEREPVHPARPQMTAA